MGPLEVAALVSGSLIGLTAFCVALAKVATFFRKVIHFIDDVAGEPARDGVNARPGMMSRVKDIEAELKGEEAHDGVTARPSMLARVKTIEAQLTTNGGSSMRDAVNRIETRVNRIEHHVGMLEE